MTNLFKWIMEIEDSLSTIYQTSIINCNLITKIKKLRKSSNFKEIRICWIKLMNLNKSPWLKLKYQMIERNLYWLIPKLEARKWIRSKIFIII